jgi:hypothetical protein
MIYLEEHRDVGDSVMRARQLATDHEEYAEAAMVLYINRAIYIQFSPMSKRREI